MKLTASIVLTLEFVGFLTATPATVSDADKAAYARMGREQAECAVVMQSAAACHGSLSLDDRASRATMETLAAVLLKARDENYRKADTHFLTFRDTSDGCEDTFNRLQALGERCVWLALNDTRGKERLIELRPPRRAWP